MADPSGPLPDAGRVAVVDAGALRVNTFLRAGRASSFVAVDFGVWAGSAEETGGACAEAEVITDPDAVGRVGTWGLEVAEARTGPQAAGDARAMRRPSPNSSASSSLTTAKAPAGTPGSVATREAAASSSCSPAPVRKKT